MDLSRSQRVVQIATDGSVLARAAVTGVVVGLVLTLIGHGQGLWRGDYDPALAWQLPLMFAVPFAVSLISSVSVLARREVTSEDRILLDHEVRAINKFPDQNPNPVLRLTPGGIVLYANPAGAAILAAFGLEVGGRLSPDQLTSIVRPPSAAEAPASVQAGKRWFRLHTVPVPEFGFINLYGTDITGERVLERFPDQNPNSVLRLNEDDRLVYANAASAALLKDLGLAVGRQLPEALRQSVAEARAHGTALELRGGNRVFSFTPVRVEEFAFTNLYGTDITAEIAVNKFPDQNPNPVLRLNPEGILVYANAAAEAVVAGLGAALGDRLPAAFLARVHTLIASGSAATLEIRYEERIFELLAVSNYEFGFITLYGTDVTAERGIAEALAENERLLLNILPAAIAERLRHGEAPIADRFDAITVLFADVVNFTDLASLLEPSDVVEVLNGIFSKFDAVVDRYGLEKIKTIGDAYMVVGGLFGEEDHVSRLADMGLAMMSALDDYRHETGHRIEVRAGMHAGPGAAGVIGVKKFVYDVWGDTVNTASRMESQGEPGRIQLTESTYEMLKDSHEFEARGRVHIKGKGDLMTYFLVGRRAPVKSAARD